MGHPRADLSRRGRVLLWTDRHPILAHAVAAGVGWLYLFGLFALTFGGAR